MLSRALEQSPGSGMELGHSLEYRCCELLPKWCWGKEALGGCQVLAVVANPRPAVANQVRGIVHLGENSQ